MTKLAIACLTYHDVTDTPGSSGFDRPGAVPYKLSPSVFERHLDDIADGPVQPKRVFDIDFKRPERHLLLSFDDGGTSSVFAADTLAKRGWCGHFFIVTSLVGRQGFVTVDDLRYLTSCGHVVGSHSHTHPNIFREQTLEQMIAEWRTSCDQLAEAIGAPCRVASIPGGDSSTLVLRSAAEASLQHLFTSEPRLSPQLVGECHVVGRFATKTTTSRRQIRRLIRFRGWNRAMTVRRTKNLVRWSAPWLYRSYVRTTTRRDGGR